MKNKELLKKIGLVILTLITFASYCIQVRGVYLVSADEKTHYELYQTSVDICGLELFVLDSNSLIYVIGYKMIRILLTLCLAICILRYFKNRTFR